MWVASRGAFLLRWIDQSRAWSRAFLRLIEWVSASLKSLCLCGLLFFDYRRSFLEKCYSESRKEIWIDYNVDRCKEPSMKVDLGRGMKMRGRNGWLKFSRSFVNVICRLWSVECSKWRFCPSDYKIDRSVVNRWTCLIIKFCRLWSVSNDVFVPRIKK